MTITEKIIAAHCGLGQVRPGQIVEAGVDLCLGNDITAPIAIREFEQAGFKKVFDNSRIALVPDHFTPNKDIASANQALVLRNFAKKHGIVHYFEVGEVGIEHILLPEKGLVRPGQLVIGADSHTCTYGALGAFSTGVGSTDLAAAMYCGKVWLRVPASIKFNLTGKKRPWAAGKDIILYIIGKIGVDGALYRAMEYCGTGVGELGIEDRLTICNMAIEAGAKNGIFSVDRVTESYVKAAAKTSFDVYSSDADASYEIEHTIDLSSIDPVVALPHLPENVESAAEVSKKRIRVDQVVIGSCTNGHLSDLRVAAQILKGKKIAKGLRMIVFPATPKIYKEAMKEGLFDIFLDAGGVISPPTCGPCLGGHMGILGKGEKAIATTNRNFLGRMGDPSSEVYLAGPAVAAASAVAGYIVSPQEVIS